MGGRTVNLAYAKGSNNVVYRAGRMTVASSGWSTKRAPKLPATDEARTECIANTNNNQIDDPAIQTASAGSETAQEMYGGRDEQFFVNHQIWFTHSKDGGATWAPMVVVADNGGNTMGAPVSTSIDTAGHFASFAQMNGDNEGSVKCGLPSGRTLGRLAE